MKLLRTMNLRLMNFYIVEPDLTTFSDQYNLANSQCFYGKFRLRESFWRAHSVVRTHRDRYCMHCPKHETAETIKRHPMLIAVNSTHTLFSAKFSD